MRPPPEGCSPVRIVRNRVNQVSGLLLAFGWAAFAAFMDPFHVFSSRFDRQGAEGWVLALSFVGAAVMSVEAYAFLHRPRLELLPDGVVVRNPLRDTAIPYADLLDVAEGKHLVLHTRHGKVTAWGTERSNLDLFRGKTYGQIVPASDLQAEDRCVTRYSRKVRRPAVAEMALVAFWVLFFASALASRS